MISLILACTLWSKPEVKLVEVPVEYGMATVSVDFENHHFEGSVMEEYMNYVKIVSLKTEATSEAYSIHNYQLTELTVHQIEKENEASLDCEVKRVGSEEKR